MRMGTRGGRCVSILPFLKSNVRILSQWIVELEAASDLTHRDQLHVAILVDPLAVDGDQ